ncbi:PAS domain-containing protein [Roseivivax isoporae]|uniref:PAS domain S-box protein n=1 Tax=Roseivivax isoporae LMG 25204 TaxID=1449351 RepID=X7F8V8_9RHOB|nr:PAS domain-containing protein [Roseivivax isoporae]ETX29347.1 hypothetical protein RISW2_01370 [Roseivivax isoporae LMG 25204]
MTASAFDKDLPGDSLARALGAALLSDGPTLIFDAATGALSSANEAALFLLELCEDGLSHYRFETLCAVDGADAETLWSEVRDGLRIRWQGTLTAVLSGDAHAVEIVAARLADEGKPARVAVHATPGRRASGPAAQASAASGPFDAIADVIGLIEYDADGIVTNANDRACMALEFYGTGMTGRGHDTLWPPSMSQSPDYVAFWEKLRQGRIVEGRYLHVGAEGGQIWLQSTYVPVRTADGHVTRVIQCLMDVTDDSVSATRNRAQVEAVWAALPIIEYDVEGFVQRVTPRMLDLLGRKEEEVIGKNSRRLMDQEFALGKDFLATWEGALRGISTSIDVPHVDTQRGRHWTRSRFVPIVDGAGKVDRVAEIAVDIHADRESLDHLSLRYEAMTQDMALVDWDLSGKLVHANKNYLTLMSMDPAQAVGREHRTTVPAEFASSRRYTQFWDRLARGETITGEFRRITDDGQEVWLQSSYVPLRNGVDDALQQIFLFARDITRLKRQQIDAQARIDAIERSMAVVEFDRDGTVRTANQNFLDTMGYTLEEIKGRRHAMFCDTEMVNTDQYRTFWEPRSSTCRGRQAA